MYIPRISLTSRLRDEGWESGNKGSKVESQESNSRILNSGVGNLKVVAWQASERERGRERERRVRDADVALNEFLAITKDIVADLGSQSCRGRPPPSSFPSCPPFSSPSHSPTLPFCLHYRERAKSIGLFQIPGRTMRFAGLVPGLSHEWKRVRQDRWWGRAAFRGGLVYNRDVSNPTWAGVPRRTRARLRHRGRTAAGLEAIQVSFVKRVGGDPALRRRTGAFAEMEKRGEAVSR